MRDSIKLPMENSPKLDNANRSLPEPFVNALLAVQERLYAYLLTLSQDPKQAEELLQETNLTLCRQSDQFATVEDFTGWACRVAYYEVLTYRKRRGRDRHTFSDLLLEKIADRAAAKIPEYDLRKNALDHCLARLSDLQRDMILQRYGPGGSVKVIAEKYNRSMGSISQSLYRVRASLMGCIQRALATLD